MMLPILRTRYRPVSVFGHPFETFNRLSRWFDDFSDVPVSAQKIGYDVDVREDETQFHVVAELPGLAKDDVDITLEDGVLTISGEKKDERDENKDGYHLRERHYGRFSRSFRLPTDVDESKIEAHLKDGLLTVDVPKTEAAKPKSIKVKAG